MLRYTIWCAALPYAQGRVRQVEDALKELARERSEAEEGSQLVWQTHTELADQR